MFSFEIINKSKKPQKIYIFSDLNGFSKPTYNVVSLLPFQTDTVGATPILDYIKLSKLKEPKNVNFSITVLSETKDTILKKNEVIKLSSNNSAIFAINELNRKINLYNYLSLWVTPNITDFNEILRNAAENNKYKALFGYQKISNLTKDQSVDLQVESIYKTLKKLDISYLNAPTTYIGSQIIKSPKTVLQTKSANCIEGVLLFASLLETIGIDPLVVLIDGHAFLGWRLWSNSKNVHFLETTYIWSVDNYSFKQAVKTGNQEYVDNFSSNNNGNHIVDIAINRKNNIMPGFF